MRSPTWVYIVSSDRGVEQAFARREDADAFASQNPEAWISRHQVRQSFDEAVEIFDRRVVVAHGATVLDHTSVVRQFIDDPLDRPGPADVEWFLDTTDSGWHIAGFGIDKTAMDAQVQNAVDRVCRLGHEATTATAGGASSS